MIIIIINSDQIKKQGKRRRKQGRSKEEALL